METATDRLRLILGDEGLARVANATVMVVGCGAVGSFAIESLARTGIGNLIVIDFDTVAPSNINRQLIATHSNIGRPKVDVMRERIADINPHIKVTIFDMFFDNKTTLSIRPDFVIDAIDTVDSKIAIYRWCKQNKIPFISSMGAARKTDPTKIKIDKISRTFACPLAARIRKIVRDERIGDFPVVFSTESPAPHHGTNKEFGSIVTVTGTFGLFAANWVIQKITE